MTTNGEEVCATEYTVYKERRRHRSRYVLTAIKKTPDKIVGEE